VIQDSADFSIPRQRKTCPCLKVVVMAVVVMALEMPELKQAAYSWPQISGS